MNQEQIVTFAQNLITLAVLSHSQYKLQNASIWAVCILRIDLFCTIHNADYLRSSSVQFAP